MKSQNPLLLTKEKKYFILRSKPGGGEEQNSRIYAYPKDISSMGNANSLIQDLNASQHVHF